MTARLFISDLHLEDESSETFQRFQELIMNESRIVDEIYILGDLVEMWIGDDDDAPVSTALAEVLSAADCDIGLMHGNRDFLFGESFAERTGVRLLPDPFPLDDGTLLSHGDAYCTDDAAYQQMRALFRSTEWQTDILGKSLAERKALGQMLRVQSKAENANKSSNIMDVNQNEITALLDHHDADTLIHGHTHRPGIHTMGSRRRIVLGAWERCGWLARQNDSSLSLECFPLHRPYTG